MSDGARSIEDSIARNGAPLSAFTDQTSVQQAELNPCKSLLRPSAINTIVWFCRNILNRSAVVSGPGFSVNQGAGGPPRAIFPFSAFTTCFAKLHPVLTDHWYDPPSRAAFTHSWVSVRLSQSGAENERSAELERSLPPKWRSQKRTHQAAVFEARCARSSLRTRATSHVVEYVEGPNGEKLDSDWIMKWCAQNIVGQSG